MSSSHNGVDITSHDTYVSGVPYEEFARLRRDEPISWTTESDGGRGFWSVTKYDDVLHASRHSEIFSSALGIRLEDMDDDESAARRTLMEMDPPQHTVLRRLVNRPFTPRAVSEYENDVREIAQDLLRRLERQESFDFVANVARELPLRMLGRLLGLPDEDLEWLVSRGDALIGNSDPEFTQYVIDRSDTSAYRLLPFRSPVSLELFEYAQAALDQRRHTPTHDVLSALLAPTVSGEQLDDLALKNFFTLMVAAGNDTTRYTLAWAVQLFIDRPDVLDRFRVGEIGERRAIVEEILRLASTTMHFRRTLLVDTEMRGVSMKAGDKVVLWYVSANYDEEHFEAASEFRPQRTPNDHVAFGLHSAHLCLGAHLARLELRVMFEEMANSWLSIDAAGESERFRSNFISGVKRQPISVAWR
jgi:cytochrome P450